MPNKLLTNEQINDRLRQYYTEVCGEQSSDIVYEQPAANVWVFSRDGKIVVLKCHIISGKVTQQTEE